MGEFDYKLFHTLFDTLCAFDEFLDGEEEIEGAKVEDDWDEDKTDITGCLHLSIFDTLKKMCDKGEFVRGENVDLTEYREIKKDKKIVGAKGIMSSNMDWCDAENPQYYYEFAHLETGGKVEEYIRELHVDEIVIKVFSDSFGDKIALLPNGRDESKKMIEQLIKNCTGEKYTVDAKGLKYKCLLEGKQDNGKYLEIWKLGYAGSIDDSYMLFMAGPQFLGELSADFVIKPYLQEKKLGKKIGSFKKMSEEEIAKLIVYDNDGTWYHTGKIELEPEKKAKAEKKQQDMDAILNPYGPDRKATKGLIDALSTVKGPADKYAKDLIEKIKKGYKIQTGEDF